jgi:NADH-quinone oxidoreductase subunit B
MVTANTDFTYNSKIEGDIIVTRADAAINWVRNNSMWPMPINSRPITRHQRVSIAPP